MKLCPICCAANNIVESSPDCEVCDGKAMETENMIAKAVDMLKSESISSFSISSLVPKDWLTKEEKIWDVKSSKSNTIKAYLNRLIAKSLSKKTNLPYLTDGDCRIVFDYSNCSVSISRNELFIFGRYKKLVTGLSQSRWLCGECFGKGCSKCDGKGKNFESVEERIGDPFKKASGAIDYVMHASGREDVDATNTGGRAFVLELKEPKIRNLNLKKIADEIASGHEVEIIDFRIVPRTFSELVTESHFDKTYDAQIEFSSAIEKKSFESLLNSLVGKMIAQQTPTRVSHRRADLIRHRKIKSITLISCSNTTARVRIQAEAGTYIKELISGDNGRTQPSISGLINTGALCTKLEVVAIDDSFIDFCLENSRS